MTEITKYDYSINFEELDLKSLTLVDNKKDIDIVINSYYSTNTKNSKSNIDDLYDDRDIIDNNSRQIVDTARLLDSEETEEVLEAKEKVKIQDELEKQKEILNKKLSKIQIIENEPQKDEKIAVFTKNIREIMPLISGTQRSKVMFQLFYSKYFSVNAYKEDTAKNSEKNKNIIKMKPEILKLQSIDLLLNSEDEQITEEQNEVYSKVFNYINKTNIIAKTDSMLISYVGFISSLIKDNMFINNNDLFINTNEYNLKAESSLFLRNNSDDANVKSLTSSFMIKYLTGVNSFGETKSNILAKSNTKSTLTEEDLEEKKKKLEQKKEEARIKKQMKQYEDKDAEYDNYYY